MFAAVMLLVPAAGSAQVPTLPPVLPSESPSPSPSPSPSSRPKPKPTQAPQPEASRSPASPVDPDTAARIAGFLGLDDNGARTTTRLLELLDELKPGEEPLTAAEAAAGFGRFPVVGYVWYQNDYGAPRYVPYYHAHEGTDLFAIEGTPVIASDDGVISRLGDFSVGGTAVWLERDDGTYFYYGHLRSYREDLKIGTPVRTGELIGEVGATGSAKGTYPHVHFEIHPRGGESVNPKPVLDRWLDNAEAAAERLIRDEREFNVLSRLGAARWSELVDLLERPAAFQPALWPSAVDPAGITFGFADLVLGSLAGAVDFEAAAAQQITESLVSGGGESSLTAGAADPLERLRSVAAASGAHPYVPFVELVGESAPVSFAGEATPHLD